MGGAAEEGRKIMGALGGGLTGYHISLGFNFTLLILRLTAVWPVALWGSMVNPGGGSFSSTRNTELVPVSVSLISMFRLARGVP